MKPKASILISAAAGGIVPNLVRIAVALQQETFRLPSPARALTYSVGLLMMAGAGAFMAWVFDETEKKKSFYLGVGLPALLQLTFSNIDAGKAVVSPPPSEPPVVGFSSSIFVSTAYAEPPAVRRAPGRKVRVTLDKLQGGEEVTFYSQNGRQKKSQELTVTPATLPVPDFADYCTLRYKQAVSAPAALDAPMTEVSATVEENKWSGFWQALGSNANPSYKIVVNSKEP